MQREFNPYFYEIPIAAAAAYATPPVVQAQPVAADDGALQEWQVGQALPAAPTEMLYPEGATVVIEGPSTTDEAGNRVEGTVMVGRRQDTADTDWGADASGARSSQMRAMQGGAVHSLPGQSYASGEGGYGEGDGGGSSKKKKKKKKKHHDGGGLGP
eukprot:COSAG06_NODE_320_length_17586_cov_9.121347_2_plen_157_part_00